MCRPNWIRRNIGRGFGVFRVKSNRRRRKMIGVVEPISSIRHCPSSVNRFSVSPKQHNSYQSQSNTPEIAGSIPRFPRQVKLHPMILGCSGTCVLSSFSIGLAPNVQEGMSGHRPCRRSYLERRTRSHFLGVRFQSIISVLMECRRDRVHCPFDTGQP